MNAEEWDSVTTISSKYGNKDLDILISQTMSILRQHARRKTSTELRTERCSLSSTTCHYCRVDYTLDPKTIPNPTTSGYLTFLTKTPRTTSRPPRADHFTGTMK